MNWSEITVSVNLADTETTSAIANMTVPYGIYIEDYSDLEEGAWEIAHIDIIDEELIKKDRTKSIIHIYISECDNAVEALEFLKERLRAEKIEFEVGCVGVNDADWNENWKKYFKATEIGKRLAIVPSWEKYENEDNRTILQIDPGAAFGTGTHATTSLCLELLEELSGEGKTTLDIGCGSGILAIASVLLGCEKADGVDIDAQSVKTANENAEINNISDKANFIVGDLADKITDKYDIVCANIVADVVMRLFENAADYMKANASFIISGIIDMRAKEVEESAISHGFDIVRSVTKDNWHAYLLKQTNEGNEC